VPLELVNPEGLWLLGALAPLVALYLLRVRRLRRAVPSTWLWREVQRDLVAHRPFRRLVAELPLLLEALAVLALALALAQPSLKGAAPSAAHVAIVVDTSASLSARGGSGRHTRFDAAVRAARDAVSKLPSDADVLLVDAGAQPAFVTGLERDPRRIAAAVGKLAPRDEPENLGGAIALAAERLRRASGTRRIIVVTDVNGEVPSISGIPLDVVRVGSFEDNVALGRLEVRRALDPATGRETASAFVLVENHGATRADRFVTLHRRGDSTPIDSRRLALSPGERLGVILSFEPRVDDTGKGIVAELTPNDGLSTDDQAVALIPPGPRLPVVLAAAAQSPWLKRAFASDPNVELYETTPDALASASFPEGALITTVGFCPKAAPPGDLLVLAAPTGDCLGMSVGSEVSNPLVTWWSERDPRLRFLTLSDIGIRAARSLTAPRGSDLVRAGNAVVMADLGLPQRSGTLVSFDPDDSDWPLRASFVLFVRNVTELSRTNRARHAGVPQHTGELLRVPIASSADTALVRGPDGERPARIVEGMLVAPAPAKAGFYDVFGSSGAPLGTIAVNLGSEAESDLRRAPAARPAEAAGSSHGGAEGHAPAPSWPLALLAAACILGELAWLRHSRTGDASVPAASKAIYVTTLVAAVACATYAVLLQRNVVPEWLVRFGRPEWTLAGVLASAGFVTLSWNGGAPRTSPRRRALFETAVALSLLGACWIAAEPRLGARVDRMAILVAVDRSRSTDLSPGASGRVEHELERAAATMRPEDRLGVVAFATSAALEEPLRARGEPRSAQTAPLGRNGTNLAAGLQRALVEAPGDAATRIVLVSDGVATEGDTLAAALTATLAGVPVDVLPLEQATLPNVRVEALHAPPRAAAGETVELRVTTRATSDADVDVRVVTDGVAKGAGQRRVHAGEDVFWIREVVTEPGMHRFDVHLSPVDPRTDSIAEDNDASAFVRVEGPSRALVIESDEARATPIRTALASAAFDVDVVGATRTPTSLDALSQHDLVVLGNVPAEDLTPDQIDQLATYVRDLGGGMLLFGGDRAMGPGGYARTPLEEVSPVAFEVPNERRRARLAEVIAIDTSGSMSAPAGSTTKLALANEAAARSAELLGPGDRLGVAHVDTAVTWTVPVAPLHDAVEVGRQIRSAGPGGGGIFVDVALDAAYAALDKEAVDQKHVLVFADGDDAENRERSPDMARAALRRGITTSIVALGRGQDVQGLERISREGKGRFYLVEDAGRLPAVFARETTIAAGNAIRDVPFRAEPGAADSTTSGIDLRTAPELTGYVVTTPKPRATIALYATDRDPLLSTWSVGTGRAGAFTSEYGGKWGAAWAAWPDAARLFVQVGRDLARRAGDSSVTLDADASSGSLVVRASALSPDGSGDSFRRFAATVAGPDGFEKTVPLELTGPGTYAASLGLGHPGGYVADVRDLASQTSVGTTGAVLSAAVELEPTGTDHALLARIARTTGGKVLGNLNGLFADRPADRRAFRTLLPWLAMSSATMLLLAVAARRLSPPELGRVLTRPAPKTPSEPPRPAVPRPAESVTEELLRRRRRRE
jgi:uncharacterized membrane protein